jgi:hypothetical protein
MTPATICDKLADIGEDICQLRTAVGQTPDGLDARLANVQETISILQQDVARPLDGG